MDPARSIITKLGGETAVAHICGTAASAPYRWQYARERHHRALMDYAEAKRIPLAAEEFLAPRRPPPAGGGETA